METTRTEVGASARRERSMPPSRLQLLERRAAAARRRLVLTVTLLVAVVAVAVAAGLGLFAWWWTTAPAVALVVVLLLGRHAAKSARRADAEWLAQRRAAIGHEPGRVSRPGRPPAVRVAPPRVTGRAVHASQTHTQMIPRVTAQDLERARAGARESRSDESTKVEETDPESNAGEIGVGAPSALVASGVGEASAVGEVPAVGVASAAHGAPASNAAAVPDVGPEPGLAPWETRPPSNRVWDPVPVPPPTYTMKASTGSERAVPDDPAPEGGPGSGSPASASGSPASGALASEAERLGSGAESPASERAASPASASGSPASGPIPVAGPVPTRSAGEEPRPKTETLGLDLNEILARRRAAGQ